MSRTLHNWLGHLHILIASHLFSIEQFTITIRELIFFFIRYSFLDFVKVKNNSNETPKIRTATPPQCIRRIEELEGICRFHSYLRKAKCASSWTCFIIVQDGGKHSLYGELEGKQTKIKLFASNASSFNLLGSALYFFHILFL